MITRAIVAVLALALNVHAQTLWVSGNPGEIPSESELKAAGMPFVGQCPYMDWYALNAIGMGGQPWPATLTQAQVRTMCKALIPNGFDGPVMWNNEGAQFVAMFDGTTAGDRADGLRWFTSLQTKAIASRSKAQHGIYIGEGHSYPPFEYQNWLDGGGADRRAMNVWRLSSISAIADRPGTCTMMSIYPVGWNDDWTEDRNVKELERWAKDNMSLALQLGEDYGQPVYAVWNGRRGGEKERVSEIAARAVLRGAMAAKPLSGGDRRIDGIIVWTAEEYVLKRDNPLLSSTEARAQARVWQLQELRWAAEALGLIPGPTPPTSAPVPPVEPPPVVVPPATQPAPTPTPGPTPPPVGTGGRTPVTGPIDVGTKAPSAPDVVVLTDKAISGDVGVRVNSGYTVGAMTLTNVGINTTNYAIFGADIKDLVVARSSLKTNGGGDDYVVRGQFGSITSSDTTYENSGGNKASLRLMACGSGTFTRDTIRGARMMLGGGFSNERIDPGSCTNITFSGCRIAVNSIEFYPRTSAIRFENCNFTGTGHFTFWEDAQYGNAHDITFYHCTMDGLPMRQAALGTVNNAAGRSIVVQN